ncbi:MAG: N-formylglutamate amidohydrolase [Candidatus Njordarchaeales archaeon]
MKISVTDTLSDTMAVIVHRELFPIYKVAIISSKNYSLPVCVLPNDHPDINIKMGRDDILLTSKILKELEVSADKLEVRPVSRGLFVYGTLLPTWITPEGEIGHCWARLDSSLSVKTVLRDYEIIYRGGLPYAQQASGEDILGVTYLEVPLEEKNRIHNIEISAGYKVSIEKGYIVENFPMRRTIQVKFYSSRRRLEGRKIFTMLYGETFHLRGSLVHYESDPTGYITWLRGNCSLLLTVPHGGYWRPVNIVKRREKEADEETQELVRELVKNFYELSNGAFLPYVVLANLHRSRIDFNRDYEIRETRIAKKYHNKIETFLRERNIFLLLDIHGMSEKNRHDIELGTCEGKTVKGYEEVLETLYTELKRENFSVLVDEYYPGEYTVKRYGENKNVIAIQVEINKQLRKLQSYKTTAKRLAKAFIKTLRTLRTKL